MLLTIHDLAERWQISTDEAIKICRARGVPYIELRSGRGQMRVNWRKVRFRLQAIEQWEQSHQTAHRTSASTGSDRQEQRGPGPWPGPGRLGDWMS